MKAISEGDKEELASWYVEAKKQTEETLPAFVRKLTSEYIHDYGTICHAVAAAALGGAYSIEHSPFGGITGFQSGAIMWEFIKHWMSIDPPLKLVKYEDMLYPQYRHKFEKTIDSDTWEHLQTKAKEKLAGDQEFVHENVKQHWESIASGIVPFGYSVVD